MRLLIFTSPSFHSISDIMFTLNDNSNKHKVAFYVALVILLITLGQFVDATEVINHSSPKNTSTDVSVIRGYDGQKSVSEKLTEVRQLLRSLIFDWNLGESGNEIIGKVTTSFFLIWFNFLLQSPLHAMMSHVLSNLIQVQVALTCPKKSNKL